MQAVILAGGKGTRLKPYTASFPKPLVPIDDKPILEIIIRQLKDQGFQEIIISTGHLAHLIEAYFGDGMRFGIPIRYVFEELPLNTAGALKLIDGLAENFLVMNGDVLTNLNCAQFLEAHKKSSAQGTVALKERRSFIDFGVVHSDTHSFLKAWDEKPQYTFDVSMGVYGLERTVIDFIGNDEAIGMPDLLMRIKSRGRGVYCYKTQCDWLDIGRADDYEKAQAEYKRIIGLVHE